MLKKLRRGIFKSSQSRIYITLKDSIAYFGAILPGTGVIFSFAGLDVTGTTSLLLISLGFLLTVGPLWVGVSPTKLKERVNMLEVRVIILESQLKAVKHFGIIALLAYFNSRYGLVEKLIEFLLDSLTTIFQITPWIVIAVLLIIVALISFSFSNPKSISETIDKLASDEEKREKKNSRRSSMTISEYHDMRRGHPNNRRKFGRKRRRV